MAKKLSILARKFIGPLSAARYGALGFAQDFWKNGPENPLGFLNFLPLLKGKDGEHDPAVTSATSPTTPTSQAKVKSATPRATTVAGPGLLQGLIANFKALLASLGAGSKAAKPAAPARTARKSFSDHIAPPPLWHAQPGEIEEKMWGDGCVTPADDRLFDLMIKPLGLTSEMDVLDLSAGLGERARRMSQETGAYISGLEEISAVAWRGSDRLQHLNTKRVTLHPYHFGAIQLDRSYDAILARDIFNRVADKNGFIKKIGEHLKPHGQVAFTDFMLDPTLDPSPAITQWLVVEKDARPLGLVEMADCWARAAVTIRINEDITAMYKAEIASGLKKLAIFLTYGDKPDADSKKLLMHTVQIWASRLAAIEQGLKVFRFYGTK